MASEPQEWADALETLLSLLPDQTMRLDAEGYEALQTAGLDRPRADAAVTMMKHRTQLVKTWEDDGTVVVRLPAEGEVIERRVEPPIQPRPKKVKRMATEKQANYLRVLGYKGKPIERLTLNQARAAIGRLVRGRK